MTTEPPIACSLNATELPIRLAAMADLGRDALLEAHTEERRAVLRFAAAPGVHERVADIAAAESECCAFLTMRMSASSGEVELSITAPEGAEPVLEELVSAFRGQSHAA
jgi:hypothetical protein